MNVLIGNVLIGLGISFVFVGMYGFFKFEDFKAKLLVAATIDAMALLTVLIGAMVRSGVTWFSLKVALILGIALVLNPVSTSKIALSEKTNEDRKMSAAAREEI
ncbi:MAG: monovalent cation/H(+) antiporter subunit G [Turicibacter sp.]|nr:monovalent cation/H(+) antiporter subunit G [Turicibacter sp.]